MKTVNLKTIEQNDNVSLYSICFDELLKQAQRNGTITIEKNMIVGIENKTFEL